MIIAVVNIETHRTVNIISADPSDRPVEGHWLAVVPNDLAAPPTRYEYTPETGFVPDAEYQAEMDAEAAAAESEGLSEAP